MTISSALCRLCDGILCLAWAPRCAACDRLIDGPTQGVVCGACWYQVQRITPPLCEQCGLPVARLEGDGVMSALCRPTSAVTRRRAAGFYDGSLRAIIHAFKYQRRRSLARPLARLMLAAGHELLADAHCVVPVSLHPRRQWRRGFNQAAILAHHLDLPVVDLLRRTRPTPPQTSLSAAQRHRNVKNAFAPRRVSSRRRRTQASTINDGIVVLVDDVSTTGATLEACGQVLKEMGAREVRGITAAAATRESLPHRPRQHQPDAHRPPAPSLAAPPAADNFL